MNNSRVNLIEDKLNEYISIAHSDINKTKNNTYVLILSKQLSEETCETPKIIQVNNKKEAIFIIDALELMSYVHPGEYPNIVVYGKVVNSNSKKKLIDIPLENGNITVQVKYFKQYDIKTKSKESNN